MLVVLHSLFLFFGRNTGCGQGGAAGGPAGGGRRVYVDERTFSCTHTHACCSRAALGSPARAPSGQGARAGRGPLTGVAGPVSPVRPSGADVVDMASEPPQVAFPEADRGQWGAQPPRLRLPRGASPGPETAWPPPGGDRGDWRALALLSPQPEHTRGPGGRVSAGGRTDGAVVAVSARLETPSPQARRRLGLAISLRGARGAPC